MPKTENLGKDEISSEEQSDEREGKGQNHEELVERDEAEQQSHVREDPFEKVGQTDRREGEQKRMPIPTEGKENGGGGINTENKDYTQHENTTGHRLNTAATK